MKTEKLKCSVWLIHCCFYLIHLIRRRKKWNKSTNLEPIKGLYLYFLPPANGVEGKSCLFVVCVCHSTQGGGVSLHRVRPQPPPNMFNLVQLAHHCTRDCPHDMFELVHYRSHMDCRQAGGWHSTEMPSFLSSSVAPAYIHSFNLISVVVCDQVFGWSVNSGSH